MARCDDGRFARPGGASVISVVEATGGGVIARGMTEFFEGKLG